MLEYLNKELEKEERSNVTTLKDYDINVGNTLVIKDL